MYVTNAVEFKFEEKKIPFNYKMRNKGQTVIAW